MSLPPTHPDEAASGGPQGDAGLAGAERDNEKPEVARTAATDAADDADDCFTEEELEMLQSPGLSLETFLKWGILTLLAISVASVLFPVR